MTNWCLAASLYGPEGVWSYDINGTAYMVVVAWSVPWNDAFYEEKFNVKVNTHLRESGVVMSTEQVLALTWSVPWNDVVCEGKFIQHEGMIPSLCFNSAVQNETDRVPNENVYSHPRYC